MKKILMTMVAVFAAMNMNAQVYIGGSVALEAWSSQRLAGDKSETAFKLMPEIGYNLNEKWSIGTVIGYQSDKFNGVKFGNVNLPRRPLHILKAPPREPLRRRWSRLHLGLEG